MSDDYSDDLIFGRKILMCEVCLCCFNGEDDVTETCATCGREGFCRDCAKVGGHDCDEPRFNLLGGGGDESE